MRLLKSRKKMRLIADYQARDEEEEQPIGLTIWQFLAVGIGGICRGSGQFGSKSCCLLRLVQRFIFGREIFSRGVNETRRQAALLDEDFIAGQGLGFCILITILPEQHPPQFYVHYGEVYIVRRERFFIAADHVAKKLFSARVVLLV